MIIQGLLNWLAELIAGFMAMMPSIPPQLLDGVLFIADAFVMVNPYIAKFSNVVPFEVIGVCMALVPLVWGFWLLTLFVRTILWAFDR